MNLQFFIAEGFLQNNDLSQGSFLIHSNFLIQLLHIQYIFQLFTIVNGFIPIFCILYLISFPQAIRLINLLKSSYNKPSAIKNCKFIAIKFQTLNGVGLITGLIFNYLLNK